ncbi:MAG TPA: diiron oxygenase [Pyrinomonadaceae bacterium]|nr:diiron oxygenase [Pyrinomonadaceae bacterium]
MLGTSLSTSRVNNGAYDYRETLVASEKVNWNLDDIIGGDKKLDFSKRFMPENLARVDGLGFLNDDEKRILNQIRGNAYLTVFGIVEEFIVPFVIDHVRPSLDTDDYRVRAFLQFVGEEVKHIQLFKRFCEEFKNGFATEHKVIGPASEIGKAVLAHNPLSVALVILMIEWMTQAHYLDSMKDNNDMDPQFKSLLKNHWLEEAQHAKLDTRMVESLADGATADEITAAIDGFLAVGGFLDEGLKQQTLFDLEALEVATGRKLTEEEREEFVTTQLQANRWTYIGSGMVHPKFQQMLDRLGGDARKRIDEVAPVFA